MAILRIKPFKAGFRNSPIYQSRPGPRPSFTVNERNSWKKKKIAGSIVRDIFVAGTIVGIDQTVVVSVLSSQELRDSVGDAIGSCSAAVPEKKKTAGRRRISLYLYTATNKTKPKPAHSVHVKMRSHKRCQCDESRMRIKYM